MKSILFKFTLLIFIATISFKGNAQKFQGQAFYISKSKMDLGNWGARMSEERKKQMASRLKNRLEKKYILSLKN